MRDGCRKQLQGGLCVCRTAALLMQIIETSREKDPMVFEVGAGDVVGSEVFRSQDSMQHGKQSGCGPCLLQAFDSAVRGLTVGAKEYLQVRSQRLQKSLCEA